MKLATGTTIVKNGQLIDGTGRAPVLNAALVICDGRIVYAGPAAESPALPQGTESIDACGGTIMPGLVEAHFHATYFNIASLEDLDIKYPVEYVSMLACVNTRLALECGYTAARSGGCLFNVDVWLKKAIEENLIAGPRLSASGREICSAGGLMDWLLTQAWLPVSTCRPVQLRLLEVISLDTLARSPKHCHYCRSQSNGTRSCLPACTLNDLLQDFESLPFLELQPGNGQGPRSWSPQPSVLVQPILSKRSINRIRRFNSP